MADSKGEPDSPLTLAEVQETVRQLQAQAQQRRVVLETARRVALDILAQRSGVDALQHISEAARSLVNARYAALGVAEPGGEGLQAFVVAGLSDAEVAALGAPPKGRGILGLLLQREEPLRIRYLSQHSSAVGFPPGHPPMESFLGVPIRREGVALGSLYLTDKRGSEEFTEDDVAAVAELGAYAAVAIHSLQMQARQRALLARLIDAQEEERRAVAYDLHDGLTQFVMAAQAHLEAFRRARSFGREETAGEQLEQGLKYLGEAVLESRRMVNGLRLLALDDLGIAGALEQLLTEEKTRAAWKETEFVHNVAGRRYDRSLETTLYRVAQEALTNVRKHAAAEVVGLRLLTSADPATGRESLTLEVRDQGVGFDVAAPGSGYGESGVGLHGMIERIRLLHGTYTLTSAPGRGTVVRAVFPVPEKPVEEQAVAPVIAE